jgi:hypothetical protein
MTVNSVEKRYASDEYTRFYDEFGWPITSKVGGAFFNSKVELAVENKAGREYVIEMRPAR